LIIFFGTRIISSIYKYETKGIIRYLIFESAKATRWGKGSCWVRDSVSGTII